MNYSGQIKCSDFYNVFQNYTFKCMYVLVCTPENKKQRIKGENSWDILNESPVVCGYSKKKRRNAKAHDYIIIL